jgi:hypothetical protein
MKRTIRLFGIALLVLAFANAAMAENANQRMVGKKGIGYYNSDAPVGMRYWMSDAMAVDVGVGLDVLTKQDNSASSPAIEDETFLNWAFDVGLPWVLHSEENTIVYFRPGVTLVGDKNFDNSTLEPADTAYDMTFTGGLGLGGEFFLGQLGWPNLSFSGDVGIGFNVFLPKEDGAETQFNLGTTSNDVSVVNTGSIGFHIYF